MKQVMDWKRRHTWKGLVHRTLVRVVGLDYPNLLWTAAEPIDAVDDSLAVFAAFEGRVCRDRLVRAVEREWAHSVTHVMAYHACRTGDVSAYYRCGIRPLRPEATQRAFRAQFGRPPYAVPDETLDAAIAAVSTDTRDGRVHLGLDDRDLVEDCGHYLIYGGEYLHALVVHIAGREEELRAELRNSGRATVLRCCLPARWIRHREDLVSSMIADHAYALVHGPRSPHWLDHTVTLKHSIGPQWIKSHRHPVRIRDPFNWRIWNDRARRYEAVGHTISEGA